MAFVQVSAFVQTTGASSLSPSLTGVTSGNSLIYAIGLWHGSGTGSTAPTNYTEDAESASSNGGRAAIGSRHSVSSGTHTPSIGLGASSWARAALLEYSAITTAEGSNSGTGNGSAVSSGAVTPGASDSILIAAMSHGGNNRSLTPGGSWVQRAEDENTSSGQPINVVDLTGVTGSQTATWTKGAGGGDDDWSAAVVSYPAAAAAGRTTKNTDAYPLGINHGTSFRMGGL